jgi:hypothetical protein
VVVEFAKLAYEIAFRQVESQSQLLADIRSRTGLLLAASSLTASVIGRPALAADPVAPGVLAVAAFGLSIGASIYVVVPKRELVFALSGAGVYERLFEFRLDMPEVHRRLAYDLERLWRRNDRALKPVVRAYRVSAAALALEILFLVTGASGILG